MNSLDLLTQLKQAVQSALYVQATPEYKDMVIQGELERINCLVDKLLKERQSDDEFLSQGFPLQGEENE